VLSDFSPDICPWVDIAMTLPLFTYGQTDVIIYKYVISNNKIHDFFHNRTVIIPQPISITHIHISLVFVWNVNFVLFNSMLKYVINRLSHAFFKLFVFKCTIHCIVFFDVRNLVLCLTRELIKFIDYKIMQKLQCKTTFNSTLILFFLIQCWNMW
jgi:hypothetical protein